MLDFLIQALRRPGLDRAKAMDSSADRALASFRDLVKDHDAFVPYMERVPEPALELGSSADSSGDAVPVRLSFRDFCCHQLVQGGTGTGKTTFVSSLVAKALSHGQPIGTLDCKSGFFDAALSWAAAAAYSLDGAEQEAFIRRLAIVNPFGDHLVPLNVCRLLPGVSAEVQAYEITLAFSRLFDAALGVQMENILRHLLLLLMESELTLAEAPELLKDELLRGILVQRSQNPRLKDFFLRTYPVVPESSKNALLTRIEALLLAENLRLMLGADGLIDLKGILDRGAPLFVFLGKGPGVPEEQVDVIGSLFLQLLFQAAYAAGKERRPYQIVMDEFFHLLEAPGLQRRFETGLTTLRSFKVMMSLVMHNFSQVPGSLRETILGNCDIIAVFRTSSRNAMYFGDFLPETDPETVRQALQATGRPPGKHEIRGALIEKLQRLPDRHCYWYDRRRPYRSILLRVQDVPAPHETLGISAQELDEFMDARGIRAGGYALPKETLRRQIEDRRRRLEELVRPAISVTAAPDEEQAAPEEPAPKKPARRRRPRIG